jgi:LacI family transcriptional regulator
VTITDVAREAGVHVSTASRALLGSYGVHKATRESVLRVAERLNYHANPIAQGLVTGRSSTIGLLVSDVRNPFFSEVARGVEDAAQAAGCQVFLCNSDLDAAKQMRNFRALGARCVDGVIMNSISNLGAVDQKELVDARIPVVLLNSAPESTTTFSTLIADNLRGGYLAGEYLIALGHRSIGHVTGPRSHGNLSQRAKGFLKACESGGRQATATVLHGEHSYAGGCKLTQRLLSRNPDITAIFAGNDMMAFGAARALMEMGLKVPGDVSVIGFDDIEFANVISPPLTTIHQPKYEMGQAAVQILLAASSVPEHRILGVRLIERQSCKRLNVGEIPGHRDESPLVKANAKEGKSAAPVRKRLSPEGLA